MSLLSNLRERYRAFLERYDRQDEREFREGSAKGIVWVFLEANEAEVSWTMGWDSLGVFDMLCSSTTALREGLDPLRTFNDRLHKLVNKPPTAISESADLNLD